MTVGREPVVSRGELDLIRKKKIKRKNGQGRGNVVNGIPEDLTKGFKAFRGLRSNQGPYSCDSKY